MKSIKINDLAYKEALRLAEKYNIIDLFGNHKVIFDYLFKSSYMPV